MKIERVNEKVMQEPVTMTTDHPMPPQTLALQFKAWFARKFLSDVPLIYTSKGNIPADRLQWTTHWEITDLAITYVDTWRLDGEVVKEGRAVLGKRPLPPIGLKQAQF